MKKRKTSVEVERHSMNLIGKWERRTEEIWEHDLSTDMQIGASTEGYERVGLNCEEDRMIVQVETSKDFSGVIYTQGSFHSRQLPCFIDPDRGGNFTLTIPFNKCGIKKEGDRYKNILVLQHDDELIIPGDAAFVLECESQLKSNQVEREIKSSISLVDADPGRDKSKRFGYAASYTKEVVFAPKSILRVNDEL
ncbi:uncharacterized protein LOC108623313 isoform X2 [Ceratina calcarata]|uniref:Uncharacterized protein LOC108623313 isoform X2 n=1 Tax=Ceratina calcarata TaxID=156304 RepID=A0AAJ7N521_9HYME|nr:uncharacterized protein LOC108623313 isoform X2 [Ceratina calcarata]